MSAIPIKNKDGIAKMREACAIAATVLEQLKPLVRPGVTTQDLEEAGRDWIARLARPEISRRPASAAAEEATRLAQMRRWFFARKPDAGFVLTDFPATLLQATVFDEWLDARDESLHGVLAGPGSTESVVLHYRTLGLILETSDFAA